MLHGFVLDAICHPLISSSVHINGINSNNHLNYNVIATDSIPPFATTIYIKEDDNGTMDCIDPIIVGHDDDMCVIVFSGISNDRHPIRTKCHAHEREQQGSYQFRRRRR
jgi:hypothetical protein